jgi:hypothetical protein
MHKFAIFVSILLCLPLAASAQEQQRVIIFGGYSYLRNGSSNSLSGWEGQGTLNFNRFLGITADISGNSQTAASFALLPGLSASANQSLHTFMFGPTVTGNFGRFAVFGHALFGEARSGIGAGLSLPIVGGISLPGLPNASAFAMAYGGGIDIGLSRHFAIRAAQIDYVRTQFNSADALFTGLFGGMNGHQSDLRYSAGIVFARGKTAHHGHILY